eukprot:scaffold9455_cov130-Isochrysis_galbana.AAC.1
MGEGGDGGGTPQGGGDAGHASAAVARTVDVYGAVEGLGLEKLGSHVVGSARRRLLRVAKQATRSALVRARRGARTFVGSAPHAQATRGDAAQQGSRSMRATCVHPGACRRGPLPVHDAQITTLCTQQDITTI